LEIFFDYLLQIFEEQKYVEIVIKYLWEVVVGDLMDVVKYVGDNAVKKF